MKKGLLLTVVIIFTLALFAPATINSQQDKIEDCSILIKAPFIPNGQPLRAFLTGDEVAEFRTTFLNGSVYRLAACSAGNQSIIFSVYDTNRNLLFTNDEYNKAKVWDFKIAGSVECIIEAKLDSKEASSGMALMYIGFKRLEEK
ncbi:hypothetical protein SAMN06265379_10790 [Saccharicrinis carchari]|uniref:Uncharacterized protein n=1 Tax=Saccharicrinis carchari TaxID=1168039 RepID=A0A521E0A4_SACCC|nr:hypothetical protein [Saccharicrinis carchari]SMO77383.1 hypothetical protein SAMN06265379_10790 [Saccharicrinis carchari]